MDMPEVAALGVSFAIGWNAVTFFGALARSKPLWPSGMLLAVLIPTFILLKVGF
jgi:hypothetical protein